MMIPSRLICVQMTQGTAVWLPWTPTNHMGHDRAGNSGYISMLGAEGMPPPIPSSFTKAEDRFVVNPHQRKVNPLLVGTKRLDEHQTHLEEGKGLTCSPSVCHCNNALLTPGAASQTPHRELPLAVIFLVTKQTNNYSLSFGMCSSCQCSAHPKDSTGNAYEGLVWRSDCQTDNYVAAKQACELRTLPIKARLKI